MQFHIGNLSFNKNAEKIYVTSFTKIEKKSLIWQKLNKWQCLKKNQIENQAYSY